MHRLCIGNLEQRLANADELAALHVFLQHRAPDRRHDVALAQQVHLLAHLNVCSSRLLVEGAGIGAER